MSEKLLYTVPKEYDGIKAIVFLKKHCGLSSRMITQLKREKNGILMDGKILRTVDFLKNGSVVEINLPNEISDILPVKGNLEIVYEDEHIVIINKPPYMPVHPVKQHQTDTLANYLSYINKQKGEDYVFRALNRLDRNTSGLVFIAKDRFTAYALKNGISKTYLAFCHGKTKSYGTISSPIGLKDESKIVRCVRTDGAEAITHFKTLEIFNNYSLLELSLETGRTHQIRCHMSSIGHPLLGDDLYGGEMALINRQALHCNSMSFIHPVSGEKIIVKIPLPIDMLSIIQKCKKQD